MIASPDADFERAARARQNILTKPQGALGRLEDIACWFAARQKREVPELSAAISVFAGDHGVTCEGVSAYPSVVTGEMVKNFAKGGAAINVLARYNQARLSVVDVGVVSSLDEIPGIVRAKVRGGTGNLAAMPAMTVAEARQALQAGRNQANADVDSGANLLIAGEMGIGNTTASACLICAFTGAAPEAVVGLGTGIDDAARLRKIEVVKKALQRIDGANTDPLYLLSEAGGLEIAAIAGYFLQAAARGVPALLDGYISAAAALVAVRLDPAVADWLLASHLSQENGHRIALDCLGLSPLIDFQLRLGEGSGAALVLPIIESALLLHAQMATFQDAGVSGKND